MAKSSQNAVRAAIPEELPCSINLWTRADLCTWLKAQLFVKTAGKWASWPQDWWLRALDLKIEPVTNHVQPRVTQLVNNNTNSFFFSHNYCFPLFKTKTKNPQTEPTNQTNKQTLSFTLYSRHYLGFCLNRCFQDCSSLIPSKHLSPLILAF